MARKASLMIFLMDLEAFLNALELLSKRYFNSKT